MKLRLTPLNIISSVLLVSICYLLIYPDDNGFRKLGSIPLLVMLVLSFILDLIFRRLIPELKKLWIMESSFIVLVVVFFLLIAAL